MFWRKALIVIVFLSFVPFARAECMVSVYSVTRMQSTPFYTHKDSLRLLVGNIVPEGAELHFVCKDGQALRPEDDQETKCINGVIHNYPTSICIGGPLGAVVHDTGTKCPGDWTLYHVGYKFRNQLLPLYQACYDDRLKLTKYVTHELFYSNECAKRPFLYFTLDGVLPPLVEASYTPRNVDRRLQDLQMSEIRIDYERRIKIDRGHLVPCGDFAYQIHKTDTFKYVNAVPQFASNNGDGGNWNEVEKQVRGRVTPNNRVVVISGVHDILEFWRDTSNRVEMFLGEFRTVPIPKFMYKIISVDGQCEAVYMYNNPYNNPHYTPRLGCEGVPCPFKQFLPNGNTRLWGEIECCDVKKLKDIVMPGVDLRQYCKNI